jgi:hypothetical protein
VLNDKGELTEDTLKVLQIVKSYDAIVGTGHLSINEGLKVIAAAREIGCRKVILTHPYFHPPAATMDDIQKAIDLGAFVELCAGNMCPIPGYGNIDVYAETIKRFGPSHFIISSDAGQPRKSYPHETLRTFAQWLLHKGIPESDLRIMMSENYNFLLDLK